MIEQYDTYFILLYLFVNIPLLFDMTQKLLLFMLMLLLIGCSAEAPMMKPPLFMKTSAIHSGITFKNTLKETEALNYFNYSSIYFGGGVAVGDINNDGLIDVFFTGNQVENKLYLNKGNLQFEDITASSKISGDQRWYTGVTMVDINNDGFLDIYCSVAGKTGIKTTNYSSTIKTIHFLNAQKNMELII